MNDLSEPKIVDGVEIMTPERVQHLAERASSSWCEARQSGIHGRGLYATREIPAEQRIIEYVGQRISKEESERRNQEREEGQEIYLFTLDDEWDLDGGFEWNPARLINHSCEPNCEAWDEDGWLFIYSLRAIEVGEELSFDYGFELECWEDNPCKCGAASCPGYIVAKEYRKELRQLLEERRI